MDSASYGMEAGSPARIIMRVALVAVPALVALWMLWRFLPALAWAGVLAIATWPLRQWLIRRGWTATAAAAALTVLIGLFIVVPLIVFAVAGAKEGATLFRWVRDVMENGIPAPAWVATLPLVGDYLAAWWETNLADGESARALLGRTEGVARWTRTLGGEVVLRLVTLAFTLLTLFFVYRNGSQLVKESLRVGRRVFGGSASHLGREAVAAVRATVNGLVLVGLAEGVLLGIAYILAGVPHPVLFGFATAVLASVPFGAPVVLTAAAATLLVDHRFTAAVVLLAIGSALVFIADHFVRPALIGMSTRLPFLWILLGTFGGLESFGLVGLFIGPAVLAIVLAIWREAAALPDSGATSVS
jgi:predicted PurR-regulated permease PerM